MAGALGASWRLMSLCGNIDLMNRIACVVVDLALNRRFDYLIPDSLQGAVRIGARVRVPFGHTVRQGYVVDITDQSSFQNLKPITSIVGKGELLTANLIALAEWMAKYYCCPIETALRAVLPQAVQKTNIGFKHETRVGLGIRFDAANDLEPLRRKAPKQARVMELLLAHRELSLAQLAKHKVSGAIIHALEKKGFVQTTTARLERDPFAQEIFLPTEPLKLSPEQQSAPRKSAHPSPRTTDKAPLPPDRSTRQRCEVQPWSAPAAPK